MDFKQANIVKFALKSLVWIAMLAAFYIISLKKALTEYNRPGTTRLVSNEIVTSYLAPAFIFCFTPPFHQSTHLNPDFFK